MQTVLAVSAGDIQVCRVSSCADIEPWGALMGTVIEYRVNASLDGRQLQELFRHAPWSAERTQDGIQAMLKHTPVHVSAWSGDTVVGFARAITDTQYRAIIDDVIVDDQHRGRGVGTELMNRVTSQVSHLDEVYLFCHPDAIDFYRRYGFEPINCASLIRVR